MPVQVNDKSTQAVISTRGCEHPKVMRAMNEISNILRDEEYIHLLYDDNNKTTFISFTQCQTPVHSGSTR
jgi:hypothetical protein